MSRFGGALGGLLVVLGVACRDVGHVYTLTTALNREFAETRMGVSLTDRIILTVTVADSVLSISSCEAQVAVAMRVARVLRQQDPNLKSLQVVTVAFVPGRKNRKDAPVPARTAHLPIRFSPAKVAAGLGASDSTDAVSSCKAYEDLNS